MRLIRKTILLAGLFLFSISQLVVAEETLSTHIYDDIAIKNETNQQGLNRIEISKAEFHSKKIADSFFKVPNIKNIIWTITAADLSVSEGVCLQIDAELCSEYDGDINQGKKQCYGNCITDGPEFVAYDEKAKILYIDAGSNVFGTAGMPRFLFAANINNKQITYLNTFVGPYKAYLSPNRNLLAIEDGWNEISICDVKTGKTQEIREENTNSSTNKQHGLKVVKWINDEELKYEDIITHKKFQQNADVRTTKVFNLKTGKQYTIF